MADIDLNELAKTLDTEDMIGFTRAFVDDINNGLHAVNSERYPWIDELAKPSGKGLSPLVWVVQPQAEISCPFCVI